MTPDERYEWGRSSAMVYLSGLGPNDRPSAGMCPFDKGGHSVPTGNREFAVTVPEPRAAWMETCGLLDEVSDG